MANEEGMDEEKPRKRGTTIFSRSARTKRTPERLREGLGADEIARRTKLTERRVRQILAEAPEGREAKGAIPAHMQIARPAGRFVRGQGALARRRGGVAPLVAPAVDAAGARFGDVGRERSDPGGPQARPQAPLLDSKCKQMK